MILWPLSRRLQAAHCFDTARIVPVVHFVQSDAKTTLGHHHVDVVRTFAFVRFETSAVLVATYLFPNLPELQWSN